MTFVKFLYNGIGFVKMLILKKDQLTNRVKASVLNSNVNSDLFRYLTYTGLVINRVKSREGLSAMNAIRCLAFDMQKQCIELSYFKNCKSNTYRRKTESILVDIELALNLWCALYKNRAFEKQFVNGHTKRANTILRTTTKLLDRIALKILENNLSRKVLSKNGHVLIKQDQGK